MNLNLASTSTQENNPAQLFADKLLGFSGTKDWGTSSGSPQDFGLASDYSHSSLNYNLDLAKFARLNRELQNLSINSQFSFISPETILSNLTGTQTNTQFRITTRPLIQIFATHSSGSTSIAITTKSWSNSSLSDINIDQYYVSLADGSYVNGANETTDINGQATLNVPGTISGQFIAVIYAHAQASWGVTWLDINVGGGPFIPILATGISTFLLDNPNSTQNSILQYTNNTSGSTGSIITTSAYYSSTTNNITGFSVTTGNDIVLTNVGSSNPFIQVCTMKAGTNYYYRVVTEPLVFDNANFNGNFTTSQFPVYQTTGFDYANNIYSYSTVVMTSRGPLLFTVDLSNS